MARGNLHPRKRLGKYTLISHGREAALYKPGSRKRVHKYWRQDWILSNYRIFGNNRKLYRQASRRAAGAFVSTDLLTTAVKNPKHRHHGIPIDEFRKITFILSKTTEDIISQARAAGIPTPRVARARAHPTKPLYIVEYSDLSKPGHTIISGNGILDPLVRKKIKNAEKIIREINEDRKKLEELGYEEDIGTHPRYSAWILRINGQTGMAQRFLWDVTNLRIKKK